MGRVSTQWGSAKDVGGHLSVDHAILDFVPLLQREIDLDAPLLLGSVRDLESDAESVIPAELIFYPAPDVGQSIFGSSTNGLASGNSLQEASIQALLELIERHPAPEFVRGASVSRSCESSGCCAAKLPSALNETAAVESSLLTPRYAVLRSVRV